MDEPRARDDAGDGANRFADEVFVFCNIAVNWFITIATYWLVFRDQTIITLHESN